jgi:UDP-N-acetylmuramoyl-tripeptide--D-alanyl-D-alanine ligase
MIASILREEKNILVTEKNYNSCIGIPLMVLKMDSQDICVFESGIDKFGEMELESRLLKPDIAVITNIGTAHIGIFGNKETTFSEKIQITNYIKGRKKLIVNGDDSLLNKVESNEKYKVLKYFIEQAKEIEICQENTKFKTIIYEKECEVNVNQIGKHNIYNVLCAIKVAELFNISTENILKGIENYKNFVRRMQKKYIGDNILIIDDTYNASIDSMKSGLETVNILNGKRKIAVLGDMFDLGEYSEKIHLELGKIFSSLKYDILFTLGNASKSIAKSANGKVQNIKCFDNKEELIKEITSILIPEDIVYFKASNGMKFNEIISEIESFYNK